MTAPEPWCPQKELRAYSHCVCFHSCPGRSHTRTWHRCPVVCVFGNREEIAQVSNAIKGVLGVPEEKLVVSMPGKGTFASRVERVRAIHCAISICMHQVSHPLDRCMFSDTDIRMHKD